MRIAVIATNRNPLVRPWAGGQEALTAALVRGMRERGHHVLLHAAPGTDPGLADELWTYPALPPLSETARLDPQVPEPDFLADHHAFTASVAALAARTDLDVIANHSLHHLPMSLSSLLPAPVVTTLHTPPFPWMELGAALAAPTARYVAVSRALAAQWTTLTPTVVPNGADPREWPPGPGSPAGDLVWVGRVTAEKSPHLAALVARATGRRLRIVGPVGDPAYVDRVLTPLLGDGVELLGPMDTAQVAEVVGRSAAALVTPGWEEPFGLVAVEAAMTGTPVVALGRGGLPEAVPPGAGVVVPDGPDVSDEERIAALAQAVPVAERLDRAGVRTAALGLSLDRCVDGHLAILTAAASPSS